MLEAKKKKACNDKRKRLAGKEKMLAAKGNGSREKEKRSGQRMIGFL